MQTALTMIVKDSLACLLLCIPFIAFPAVCIGSPMLQGILDAYIESDISLMEYALTADYLMSCIPSLIYGYAAMMVVLEERDDGIMNILSITPLVKWGITDQELYFHVLQEEQLHL